MKLKQQLLLVEVHGNEFMHSPYSYYQCCTYDIAAVGANVSFLIYDEVWAEDRTQQRADTRCGKLQTRVKRNV